MTQPTISVAALDAFVNAAPFGAAALDHEHRFLSVNQPLAAMNGLPVGDHIGRPLSELFPDLADQLSPIIEQAIAGTSVSSQVAGRTRREAPPHGVWFTHHFAVNTDAGRAVVCTFEEITASPATAAEPGSAPMRLASIEVFAHSAPVGIAVFDAELRYVVVNDRMAGFNAIRADRHIGRSLAEVLPELAPVVAPLLHNAIDGVRRTIQIAGVTPRDIANEAQWLAHYFPVIDEDGSRYAGVIAHDITDREAARRAEMHARKRMQTQNELLTTLGNGIAHDLRSPLATAISQLELARAAIQSGRADQAAGDIADAIEVLKHGAATTAGLLRLATAMRIPSAEMIELKPVVDRAWAAIAARADDHGGAVLKVANGLPAVMGDEALLGDLMQNLLENAVKYAADGPEPARIEVRGEAIGERAIIEVCDNGPGIAESKRETLLHALARGDGSTGSGLGLAIVDRIARVHDGSVTIRDNQPHGARLVVELVAADAELIGEPLDSTGLGHAGGPDIATDSSRGRLGEISVKRTSAADQPAPEKPAN